MLSRRGFLKRSIQAGLGLLMPAAVATSQASAWTSQADAEQAAVQVNDIHSQLNPTLVGSIATPSNLETLQLLVRKTAESGNKLSIAGGRHAMGGQQFASGSTLLDSRPLNQVLNFDRQRGLIEVEAGIQWPELMAYLSGSQTISPDGNQNVWGITQKQTGADRLSIGGALSANIHGRGLDMPPMINDVESLRLINARGELIECSRSLNRKLFQLAVGGYGLFGVIYSATLRLQPRQLLQRDVGLVDIEELIPAVQQRIADGYLYGDCQFAIDPGNRDFLRRGVFSCYQPIEGKPPAPDQQAQLGDSDWQRLYDLAHIRPAEAFQQYSRYYLGTHGQRYWSDTHQLSSYTDDYHRAVDRRTAAPWPGTEMITEVYVPPAQLSSLMRRLAEDFRQYDVRVIYGTIRFIRKDRESFLPWAKDHYACVVLNLHVDHTPQGISKAAADFRRIIDRALALDGNFYLTYHRWAGREQLQAGYPRFEEFLRRKTAHDPAGLFQSDWYQHYQRMYA